MALYNITILDSGNIRYLTYNNIQEFDNVTLYLLGRVIVLCVENMRAEPTAAPPEDS